MKVSFEGIGESIISFYNNEANPAVCGKPAKISGNGEVAVCADADSFCGVRVEANEDFAAVKTAGYTVLKYSGTTAPAVGYSKLAADANGAVKAATTGREYLIIDVDTTAKTVGFML